MLRGRFRGDDTDELVFGVRGWSAGQFSKDLFRKTVRGTWEERRDFVRCFLEGASVKPEDRTVEPRFYRLSVRPACP